MKQCPKCKDYALYDDNMNTCPLCDSPLVKYHSAYPDSNMKQTPGKNVSPKKKHRTLNNANDLQKPETQTDSHKSGLYYHYTGHIKEIEVIVNIFDFFLKAIDCVSSYVPYQIGSEAYECEFELKPTDNNPDSQNHTFVFYGNPELIRIADEVSITAIKRGEKYYITKIFNVKSNKRIKPKKQISSTLFVFFLAMVYTLLLELFGLIFLALSPSLYHTSNYPLIALIIGSVCYLWWIIKYYRDKTPSYKNNSSK